jgi:class 3 adenylate cyclase
MQHTAPKRQSSTATFLFADIAGFTALTEAHGDEQAALLVAEFCDAVQSELPAFGGMHVKTIGDALMVRVRDPDRAVLLGLRIAHDVMHRHGAPAVRVGLHHGPAIERDADYFGAAVNLAARVSAAATGGEVLLTAETAALAPDVEGVLYESRGSQTFRNVREPVELVAWLTFTRGSRSTRSAGWPSTPAAPRDDSSSTTRPTSSAASPAPERSHATLGASSTDSPAAPQPELSADMAAIAALARSPISTVRP